MTYQYTIFLKKIRYVIDIGGALSFIDRYSGYLHFLVIMNRTAMSMVQQISLLKM